jgi:hypothetical protein
MSAPAEFALIGLHGEFHAARPNEYHGPCPFCGGTDRFRVHTDKAFPHWYCVCREGTGCGWKGWADELNPSIKQVTPEQRADYEMRAEQERQRRIEHRRKTLAQFSKGEIWAELHERMGEDNRAWWRKQGIPDDWQDFWKLGFTTAGPVSASGSSAWAYTIPYFRFGFEPENLQYRLVAPPNPNDKYRWSGLGFSSFYVARPDMALTDEMIICEGAKKAMVTELHSPQTMQVFAVPSKSDFAGIMEVIPGGRVWVILDPDATAQAKELARKFKDGIVVTLPAKIDDALNSGATWKDVEAAMRYARRTK